MTDFTLFRKRAKCHPFLLALSKITALPAVVQRPNNNVSKVDKTKDNEAESFNYADIGDDDNL